MAMTTKPYVPIAMLMIDTSVWISIFRDRTGQSSTALATFIGDRDTVLSRFTQLELLQGCRNEQEWSLLRDYLSGQTYLELTPDDWAEAARIFYDLQRKGLTVRSIIDCCIAQTAIHHQAVLVHNDRDFEAIAQVRSLQHYRYRVHTP
jgi:predicted nucleic acid-binding protein